MKKTQTVMNKPVYLGLSLIGIMKYELGGKFITKFVGLKTKT